MQPSLDSSSSPYASFNIQETRKDLDRLSRTFSFLWNKRNNALRKPFFFRKGCNVWFKDHEWHEKNILGSSTSCCDCATGLYRPRLAFPVHRERISHVNLRFLNCFLNTCHGTRKPGPEFPFCLSPLRPENWKKRKKAIFCDIWREAMLPRCFNLIAT